ncbi:MAG TPA: 4-alpha-glucanotransferase [Bryobacteraceae bacterium]|nr:4-alpha-glucanotransferase [Bryobacteraceae bacterium]
MREQDDRIPDSPDSRDLEEAAHAWGIETSYWDVWGREHRASPVVQTAILRSLGVDASSRASLLRAREEHDQRRWLLPLPPNVFLAQGQPSLEIPVSLPVDRAGAMSVLTVHLEEGSSRVLPIAFSEIPVAEQGAAGGCRFVRKQISLAADLPPGYHRLSLEIAGEAVPPARLIVYPSRTYQPEWLKAGRAAGLAISLYGLRSQRNWGCGDTTDLKALIDWVAEQAGASFISLNPLHDIPNRHPYNISPYLPNSIFYRNPIYLDIEQMEDFRRSPRGVALLASPAVQREIAALRATELVEYERAYRLKLRFLKLLFQTFLIEWRAKTPRAGELAAYVEREGELLDRFAVHAALDQAMHRRCRDVWNWRGWPDEYQDPESAATRAFARKHWRSVLFHKYVQWQLDRQLGTAQEHAQRRGLSIGLYHDLALATDRFGADLWAHRDFFASGCRVGAPPDGFSPKGQDWAFPPPLAERHEQDGYRLFSESIRKNSRHGGALRIDHVMRFFRLYWIPDGLEATDGTYVRDRFEALLAVLALESVRQKILVIGEDLGTVPDYVREVLHRFGILSYRLLYFERDSSGGFRPPDEYPRSALVSATTHDLPTLAGFWEGRDIDQRRDAGLLPDETTYRSMREERTAEKQRLLDRLIELKLLPDWFPRNARDVPELSGELHNAIVGFLATTPSELMLLNQEDLLKQTEQQNLPGTTFQYPNWQRKMKCTVEELWTSGEVQAFTKMFRAWLDRTGRLNQAPAGDRAAT